MVVASGELVFALPLDLPPPLLSSVVGARARTQAATSDAAHLEAAGPNTGARVLSLPLGSLEGVCSDANGPLLSAPAGTPPRLVVPSWALPLAPTVEGGSGADGATRGGKGGSTANSAPPPPLRELDVQRVRLRFCFTISHVRQVVHKEAWHTIHHLGARVGGRPARYGAHKRGWRAPARQ